MDPQMYKTDSNHPHNALVSAVQEGWLLENGDLYLLVLCADGTVRPTTIAKKSR